MYVLGIDLPGKEAGFAVDLIAVLLLLLLPPPPPSVLSLRFPGPCIAITFEISFTLCCSSLSLTAVGCTMFVPGIDRGGADGGGWDRAGDIALMEGAGSVWEGARTGD